MKRPEELGLWVSEMRELGVLHLRLPNGLEITLGPERVTSQETPQLDIAEAEKIIRSAYDDPALGVPSLPRRNMSGI